MNYTCPHCRYTCKETVLVELYDGHCPACGKDYDGEVVQNFIPQVFHDNSKEKN